MSVRDVVSVTTDGRSNAGHGAYVLEPMGSAIEMEDVDFNAKRAQIFDLFMNEDPRVRFALGRVHIRKD